MQHSGNVHVQRGGKNGFVRMFLEADSDKKLHFRMVRMHKWDAC